MQFGQASSPRETVVKAQNVGWVSAAKPNEIKALGFIAFYPSFYGSL
jgi:hypothetical protein